MISAVLVTYRCGDRFLPTLEAVLPQVGRVVIVDNGGDRETVGAIERVVARHARHASAIFNPTNIGIAGGLNVGIRRALDERPSWILTMDHDSVPAPDMVARLVEAWEKHPGKDRIALVAPRHFNNRSGREGLYPVYRRGFRALHPAFGPDTESLEPTEVISSGSLIRAEAFERVGLFDEGLFIDSVDVDFCLRLALAGYGILVPGDARMSHEMGQATEERHLGGSVSVSHHSATRRYYIARNRVRLALRYGRRFPSLATANAARLLFDIVTILRFEEDRRRKLSMTALGILDGIRGKTGNAFPESGR